MGAAAAAAAGAGATREARDGGASARPGSNKNSMIIGLSGYVGSRNGRVRERFNTHEKNDQDD